MLFTYPPIPNHPEVDLIDQQYWKMIRDEYMILFDIVKQVCGDGLLSEILEFGAGEGASTAVMLMAIPIGNVTSIDVKSTKETTKAVFALKEANLGALRSLQMSTDQFRSFEVPAPYDIAFIDAMHEHAGAAADINWAVHHCKVLVAHDICHPGTEHIGQICLDAARSVGKNYVAIEIGNGLGIIHPH